MLIPTFLSYSNKDKEVAGDIKHLLGFCGFDVFLAHEDLDVSEEWAEEIIRRLKWCQVFIALLTKNFIEPQWTNQEAGVALARRAIIVSIKVDINPPGFLAKYQYVSTREGDETRRISLTCSEIAVSLATKYPKLTDGVRTALIAGVAQADSYYAAETIMSALEGIGGLTPGQINAVVRGGGNNGQVYGSVIASPPFFRLVRTYKRVIDAAGLKALLSIRPDLNDFLK